MLSEQDWQTLVDKIKAKACTPFIGAGACAGVLPTGAALAGQLLGAEYARDSKLRARVNAGAAAVDPAGRHVRKVPDPDDLAQVTQFLAVQHEDNAWPKIQIANQWKTIAAPDFTRPDEPHAALADLNLPVYLTTNYDDFMVQALRAKKRDVKQEVCRWTSLVHDQPSSFDDGYQPTPESPVVFHLHGNAELPDSIVVTEDDYLDFMVGISKDLAVAPGQRPMLPPKIRSAITSKSLLFVGYSLNDVNFRVILRGLAGSLQPSSRHLSVAVQLPPNSVEDPEHVQAYLDRYFSWIMNVRIYWGTAQAFATELRTRLA